MKYLRLKQFFCFAVIIFISAFHCAAQDASRHGRIAILSFNGGTADERDGIAEIFSFTPQIMQNFTVIPRTTITNAISMEQSFQYSSGMTDADTMARLGYQFGADYVMAGSITSLGNSNLLIVSVVKIDVIQQVAGDYIIYSTLDDLIKNQSIIHKMAENIISIMQKDTGSMDRLAVLPVQFSGDVDKADGDALAQLLSIHLILNGKYTVYPRTQTLEQVQGEYATQLSGVTRDSQVVSLGRGVNPEFVLSIVSRKIGSTNMFNASVISLEGGNQIDGASERYANLSDGIIAMDFLAKELSGIEVSERERSLRTAAVSSVVSAEEKAAARKEAGDRFLRRSAVIVDGWFGIRSSSRIANPYESVYSGGALLGLRYGYFGLQTGFNLIGADNIVSSTVFQLPVLARARISFAGGIFSLSPYAGVGFNLSSFSNNKDAVVQSLSLLSIIGGADFGISPIFISSAVNLFLGIRYNGDIFDNVVQYKGAEQRFKNSIISGAFGLGFNIPLRKN
jgi:hypothetical protein